MGVGIREATPDDALAVRDVHLASIEGLGPSAYDPEVVAAWAHDRDPTEYPIVANNSCFLVAEKRKLVGFGWLAFEPGEHLVSEAKAEVTAVYARPEIAREGVGSALLAELERVARERGIETLGLWASLPALPFYLAQGYERVAEHTHEFAPGVEGRIVEMQTEL
jgi:putative acetyltransferase